MSPTRIARVAPVVVLLCALALTAAAQTAPPKTWYLAEGTTNWQFEEFILLANPNQEAVVARVTLLRPAAVNGTVSTPKAPVVLSYPMAGTSRRTLRLREIMQSVPELAGVSTDISVVVDCLEPVSLATCSGGRSIVVERSMYWPRSSDGAAATWLGGHNSNALAEPKTRWFLAEGATSIFDEYILIANPSATDTATVTLTFQRQGTQPETDKPWPPLTISRTVPPATRTNVVPRGDTDTKADLGNASFSAQIDSNVPVMAERSMYWPWSAVGINWRGGHESAAVPTPSLDWHFAEGYTGLFPGRQQVDTYLLIENPDTSATAEVDITYYLPPPDSRTPPPAPKTIRASIPPQTRYTRGVSVDVQGQSFGILVHGTNAVPVVAERAMYWGDQSRGWSAANWVEGHNSPGAPAEASKWGFAEGSAENGFLTYFQLRNASSSDTTARFTFMLEDDGTGCPASGSGPCAQGKGAVATYALPKNSRLTVSLDDFPPAVWGKRFAVFIESVPTSGPAVPIVAERSVYWGQATWLGGHASTGTPWPDSVTIGTPASPTAATAPVVTAISPARGPTAGGTTVTITGSNFVWPTVTIGGVPATSVAVAIGDSQAITAVTPAHAAGAADVVVRNKDASSSAAGNGLFAYVAAPPVVSAISPSLGPTAGRTSITITGTGFQTGATVSVGGNDATSVSIVNATTITALTPSGSGGDADVVVRNPDAQVGTKANGFSYIAPDLLAFGDSITYGVTCAEVAWMATSAWWLDSAPSCTKIVTVGTPYPAALARDLSAIVNNGGNPGENTSDGLARLAGTPPYGAPLLEDRHGVLTLMEGSNDASGIDAVTGAGADGIVANLQQMIDYALSRHSRVVLATIPPAVPVKGSGSDGSYWGPSEVQIELVNAAIHRLMDSVYARNTRVVLADVWTDMVGNDWNYMRDRLLGEDGLHPTQEGYDRIEGSFLRAIRDAGWK